MESSPWQPKQSRKTFGLPLRAVVLSLLLHVLVLGLLVPRIAAIPDSSAQARALQAVLLNAAFPVTTPVAVVSSSAPSRQVSQIVAEHTKKSATFAEPPVPKKEFPSVTPALGPSPPQDTLEGRVGKMGVDLSSRAVPDATRTAALPEINMRGPDAAGLRQFRLALASEARRFRRYPEVARRAGLSGTAEVRVNIDASGLTRRTDLNRSSGHEVLDAVALEMMSRAVAQASLPESLRGQEFAVLLPVVFVVDE